MHLYANFDQNIARGSSYEHCDYLLTDGRQVDGRQTNTVIIVHTYGSYICSSSSMAFSLTVGSLKISNF